MQTVTAKKMAAAAGLDFYYDTQWRSWGLVDPLLRVESEWLSPAAVRELHRDAFQDRCISPMLQRIQEAELVK